MRAGEVLAHKWKLIDLLGQGGMGSVWRAEHVELRSPAAVKLIDPQIAGSSEALARFSAEARAAASLRSSNVVSILDYGVDRGIPYIAMELLNGESLAKRLETRRVLTPLEVAAIATQVGRALTRAHEAGIVHRDLKPDNIYIVAEDDQELVKVLDFGIAKHTGAAREAVGVKTRTGSVMGTPYYMSPEQASGKRGVDHTTDIWALGVVVYECLVGCRPFDAETLGGMVLSICMDPIPVPSTVGPVPPGFDAWFARAVVREPELRFTTVKEAVTDLARLCGVAVPLPLGPMASVPLAPASSPISGARASLAGPTERLEVRPRSLAGPPSGPTPSAALSAAAFTPGATGHPGLARTTLGLSKGPPVLLFAGATLVALGLAGLGGWWLVGSSGWGTRAAAPSATETVSPGSANIAPPTAAPSVPAASAVSSSPPPAPLVSSRVTAKPPSSARPAAEPQPRSQPPSPTGTKPCDDFFCK